MLLIRHRITWAFVFILITAYATAEDDHHKRAPSGFTGVRGKKSIPDDPYNAEDVENNNLIGENDPAESKRAPSGFFGMRGKKPWNYPVYPEEMYKRAPMGFVGMRGKKEAMDDDQFLFEEFSKRAQKGFFGMRGKKYLMEPGYLGEKRTPMGFVGMRGKKDYENPSGYFEDDKRAPSGFFGMRGKKAPSGFFGMRGKKYPFEFRGKFVGVRGKKSSDITVPEDYYLEPNLGRFHDELDLNQLMLLLTEQNDAQSSQ